MSEMLSNQHDSINHLSVSLIFLEQSLSWNLFMYLCITMFQWSRWGACINCLTITLFSLKSSIFSRAHFVLPLIPVIDPLVYNQSNLSLLGSRAYFLWENTIPYFDHLRYSQYLIHSIYLVWKWLCKCSFS